jgi:hypothetical protein
VERRENHGGFPDRVKGETRGAAKETEGRGPSYGEVGFLLPKRYRALSGQSDLARRKQRNQNHAYRDEGTGVLDKGTGQIP